MRVIIIGGGGEGGVAPQALTPLHRHEAQVGGGGGGGKSPLSY